jgi:hypothetical protein
MRKMEDFPPHYSELFSRTARALARAAVVFAVLWGTGAATVGAQQTVGADVPPNAAAQITKIAPDRAAAGSTAKIEIEGSNFSAGVYVSFSTPAVRVVSTERQDATKLAANIEINPSAQAGAVTLYASNPAGAAAQTTFTIEAAGAPSTPATGAETTTQTTATETKPAAAPEVSSVEPAKVTPGSQLTLKITGKGFVDGAMVSFLNPGIQVQAAHFEKASQLNADIQVASDAATGSTSLFVVNPDDSEVEHPFEIVAGAAIAQTKTSTTTATAPTKTTGATTAKTQTAASDQKFDVYNVGEAGTILHNPTQAKGTLSISNGKLHYEENGTEVFTAAAADIQEIDENVIFGINTGTFHVILKSSKTYNFASATLRPADTQAIVTSLRRALQVN